MGKREKKEKKEKKKLTKVQKAVRVLIILLILGFAGLGAYFALGDKDQVKEIKKKVQEVIKQEEPKKLTVYDEDSNSRPIAVMIPHDTWGGAQTRQYGIQDAYVIYEILAEGGITRLMAVFKDVNTAKIGPIRSSRAYYLDYAMEHDAIYVHWGWSPGAQSDISTYKINNLNGLYEENISIYRDKNYSAPNNGFTSIEKVQNRAEQKKYATTSDNWKVFNYSPDEVTYEKDTTYQSATDLTVKYSNSYSAKYTYDAENKYYLRFNNSKAHIDNATGEQLHVKNIIVLKINYSMIAGDEKGRIDLKNIGSGDGYYLTDGGAIEIKWQKDSRTSKTKYTTLDGKELVINDGNTFVQIQPVSYTLTITGAEPEVTPNTEETKKEA